MRIIGLDPTTVEYREAWERQRRIHARVVAGEAPNTLYLVEHSSVYTAGVRTHASEHPVDGTEVVKVDRGGKITWHGPGQLVAYPIFRLPQPLDVVAYVRDLEDALIAALAHFNVSGFAREGKTGVWVRTALGRPAKIASIGVRVQRGVTLHGVALNCNNSLTPFAQIIPCGLAGEEMTTISREQGRDISPAGAAAVLTAAFADLETTYVKERTLV